MSQQTIFNNSLFEGFNFHNLPNAAHGEANHDIMTKAKATPAIVQNMPGPLGIYEVAVQNPNPTPGESNGENEEEYTPPDNDGGFGK